MSAELIGIVCAALAALAGALVEWRQQDRDGDVRERLARLEARCDALERKP